jgi:tetratricopeptide (TPR) repeat protein
MKKNSDEEIKINDLGTKFTEISLSSFISAFLEGVSSATIDKIVSKRYDTLDKIKGADVKDLCKYAELKESVAIIIKYGIIEHEKEMNEFIKSGKIKILKPFIGNINLKGISFCFTGPLEIMSRNEAKEKIRMLGGVATNAVNSDLTFLVTNDTDSGSSKNELAKEYNTNIINENEFYDIINNPEKVNEYKKRGYKRINIANNATSIRITLDDIYKPKQTDVLLKKHLSVVSESFLVKYKRDGVDLNSIRKEQNTLKAIQKNIRENQIDCLHYCYMGIAKLYYKYQDIDTELLSESLKYYLLDLELLQKYKDFMIDQRKDAFIKYASSLAKDFVDKEIEKIKNGPTYGADDTFKRAIIIYKKLGLYEKALEICDKAIEFSENNSYYDKKKKTIEKIKKSN